MPAAWRLAISALAARKLRTGLLSSAVGLSCALIVAVACATASVTATIEDRVASTLGAADARIRDVGGSRFSEGVLDLVRAWPEVRLAAARAEGAVPLLHPTTYATPTALGRGIDPADEYAIRAMQLAAGEAVRADDEIVLDQSLFDDLGIELGGWVEIARFGDPMSLRVVGVAAARPFEMAVMRPEAWLTRAALERIARGRGAPLRVDIVLAEGVDAEWFAGRYSESLPSGLLIEPTERVTSGLGDAVRANQIGLIIWSILAFLAAAFIILTGLTTSVSERQRELAVVRCIGGSRGQIGAAQLLVGAGVGALGALFGAPLGVALAWIASLIYREHLPSGLQIPVGWLAAAVLGAVACGLLAAAWPAVAASRVSPLAAMRVRARRVSARTIIVFAVVGGALLALQGALMVAAPDGQVAYWGYVFVGAPAMFLGYFLLGVPAVAVASRLFSPVLARALRVPPALLAASVRATPVRHGLTAGSLMAGLGLMTAIWINGSSLMRDWIGAIDFPDAFVHGFRGLDDSARARIDALPFVEDTCAITMQRLDTEAFGVRALRALRSTFIGFEVDPFFRMTRVEWIQGDPETARRRLNEGGAILVAREFMVAHGLGVGDWFTVTHVGRTHSFEIAGVIGSPGLDLVSKYFDVGQEYRDQALHAVFGSRRDLIEKFGNRAVHFIQIDLADDVSDEDAIAAIRAQLAGTLLSAGSGREIKAQIASIGGSTLRVVSSIAVMAIVIACFGVGNVVVAGVDARRFEMGVLRAVGARGGMLSRLVIAEVLLIALAAGVLGTLMGIQASWAGGELYRMLAGLTLSLRIPALPLAAGWAILFGLTLATAAPAAMGLARRTPRELLAATRG